MNEEINLEKSPKHWEPNVSSGRNCQCCKYFVVLKVSSLSVNCRKFHTFKNKGQSKGQNYLKFRAKYVRVKTS